MTDYILDVSFSTLDVLAQTDIYTVSDIFMTTDNAGFAVDMQADSLLTTRVLNAGTGSYAFSGPDLILSKGFNMVINAGSYSVSGGSVDMVKFSYNTPSNGYTSQTDDYNAKVSIP